MLAAGTPVVAAIGGGPMLAAPSRAEVAAAGYLAVVVTAVAFLCWYTCVARLGAERAGLLVGLMPVSALVTSLAAGQAAPSWPAAAGVTLVGLGVTAGLTARRPTPPAGRPGGQPEEVPAGAEVRPTAVLPAS
jgi:drug/metabolite transporter (DMT)-like permease